jgi:transcriptional regulator with XRE-family HTH domain
MDKSKFNKQLGIFVKEKRQELKMSQSDLACKLENNFQNISRLERGEVSPTLFWFFRLAEAFEMEPTILIKEFEKHISNKD